MTISRLLASVAFTALVACGNSGSNGSNGVTGLTGPEGPAGPPGDKGDKGDTGQNGNGGYNGDIPLPGNLYYPESLTALADGTLFVGSLGTGQIWKYTPGATAPTKFVDSDATHKSIAGVLADEAGATLWACALDTGTFATSVISFNLADGTVKTKYDFPAMGACNDMALDATGNLFATDSFGVIYKLAKGGAAVASWSSDAKLKADTMGNFGVDGIVFDGTSNFFVTNFDNGKIFRIAVQGDGTAGAIDEIVVTPALIAPDGMRLINATTLLLTEQRATGGRLTQLAVNNTAKTAAGTIIDNRLNAPTSVVKVNQTYFITEGQISELFNTMGSNPNLPFYVRRLPAFN